LLITVYAAAVAVALSLLPRHHVASSACLLFNAYGAMQAQEYASAPYVLRLFYAATLIWRFYAAASARRALSVERQMRCSAMFCCLPVRAMPRRCGTARRHESAFQQRAGVQVQLAAAWQQQRQAQKRMAER